MDGYIDYGEPLPTIDENLLLHEEAKILLAVCRELKSIVTVVELRHASRRGQPEDIIVVDFGDGTVSSRSASGVDVIERLALIYSPRIDENLPPYEVRALRRDFPITSHQNHVLAGEPASLCLYFEPWSALERTWTPHSHLRRISWWLRETSKGTLHREDQPVEPIYFSSREKLILPPDFGKTVSCAADESLNISELSFDENSGKAFYEGTFTKSSEGAKGAESIILNLPNIKSDVIENIPRSLGELDSQFQRKGASVIDEIRKQISRNPPLEISPARAGESRSTFIVLNIPRIRDLNSHIERFDSYGFLATVDLATIGISSGVLFKEPDSNKVYKDTAINSSAMAGEADDWKLIPIHPIDMKFRITPDFARIASGLSNDESMFRGVLAGVGALGSSLADTWSKEAWGEWTYIDDDTIEPHNIIRHLARDFHVGLPKVDVVKHLTDMNYAANQRSTLVVNGKINSQNNPAIQDAIRQSDLLIDVTTTLEAPRDLSNYPNTPRMASVFITPSGRDSVVLFEDNEKKIRLSALEAQYYRAILNEHWGDFHLAGNSRNLWVGAGCRDVSFILSHELIQLHAAILSKQVRQISKRPSSSINIWISDNDTGSVQAVSIPTHAVITKSCDDWSVRWDEGLQEKITNLRLQNLPNETGGILLGYLDQKLKLIYVVDASNASADSVCKPSSFIRGEAGVLESVEAAEKRTAGIVSYIGEWHSHPSNISPTPSELDIKLLATQAEKMGLDGLPCLMIIVGADGEISCSLSQAY